MNADSQPMKTYGREIDYLPDLGAKLRSLQGFATLAHELLQNADDVPAVTKFTFNICDDALIVENNGKFSDCGQPDLDECPQRDPLKPGTHRCDFHRFRRIAGADKRNEAGTTGAFGIGFISVYQITDRPELISGRHWIIDETKPANARIAECSGCDKCRAPHPGTRFILPWALNPDSEIRTRLNAAPATSETPHTFLAELERSLPTAMLFLKNLKQVEIRQNGKLTRCLERERQGNSILLTDGVPANDQVWHLFGGNFLTEADALRKRYPKLIEAKRSAEVVLAVPVTPLESGLLCATLPTQQHTGLPFHINADFYPNSDRKSIILENDFQSEWNRAALKAAALTLASSLPGLPTLLGHQRLWSLLARLQAVSADAAAGRGDKIYSQFWAELTPAIPKSSIVFTNQQAWRKPTEVFYLLEKSERAALPVLESIGLTFVHEDLRLHQNLLTTEPIKIQTLNYAHLADALKRQGLTHRFAQGSWPKFLQQPAALSTLWNELDHLVNRRRSSPIASPLVKQTIINSLSSLALAVSRDGSLCPCQEVFRVVNRNTEQIFSRLSPSLTFASNETNAFPLFSSLCPTFGSKEAIALLQHFNAATFAKAISDGLVSLDKLFAWLVDHRPEILEVPINKASLAAVPIYPSGGTYRTLNGLSLPGNFSDPLQLAALLDVKALPLHHDFLRELGILDLSFPVYVTRHLAPALANPDLVLEKRRAAAQLLATRRSEISEDAATRKVLAALPLVECADDQFHAATEVYFPGAIVSEVLGATVLQAKLPAGHETMFTEMFQWLGVAEHPRFEDITDRIKTLVSVPPAPGSLTSIRVIFAHLAERLQKEESTTALIGLRSLAWLPARQQSARWFKPAELFATFQFYLFESQAVFLDIDNATQRAATVFLNFLGVNTSPSVSQVVNHLLWCTRESKPVNQEVYAFLNNHADDAEILQLRSNPCLLLSNGHYYHPSEVFWSEHPFGRFRIQLGPELRKFNDLFQALCVRETPNHQDAQKVLSELTEQFGSRNRPLDEPARDVALHCWRMLEKALESNDLAPADLATLGDVRCVPNVQLNLTPPTWMFFEDRAGLAAKFAGYLTANAIPRPQGASQAMAAAGVRTLATAVEVLLHEFPNPVADTILAQRIQERRLQLARVLDARAAHADPSEKLKLLDAVRFDRVEKLVISYKLNGLGNPPPTAPEECPALFRPKENLLLFVATGGRVPWTSIARELALALYPDEEPGRIAPGLKEVLAAETAEEAKAILDELGFSTLETAPAPATPSAPVGALGGQTTTPEAPPATEPPPLTAGEAVDAILGPGATPPTPPPTELDKTDQPAGQPPAGAPGSGTSGGSGGSGGSSGTSGSGTRPPPPRRGKLRSYVVKDSTPSDREADPAKAKARSAIANAGVAKVMAYETKAQRVPKEMPPQNPGYDIESREGSGAIARYIEVKSISGYWGTEGVGLTSTEFSKAQKEGGDYWLYVVERADQPDARIYCIPNPALKVDQFLYDDGWQAAATETSIPDETQS